MSNTRKIKTKKKKEKQENDKLTLMIRESLASVGKRVPPAQEKLLVQIFKFVIVGGTATILDWIIYFILYKFVHMEPIIGNLIAFGVSVIYNYWASCKYVFEVTKEKSKTRLLIEFFIFAFIGLGINELLIWIFVNQLKWNAMIVKILATIIVMVFNFITRKKFLEKK